MGSLGDIQILQLGILCVQDMFILASMGPPGGGRTNISQRLQSRFNLINMTFPHVRARTCPARPDISAATKGALAKTTGCHLCVFAGVPDQTHLQHNDQSETGGL